MIIACTLVVLVVGVLIVTDRGERRSSTTSTRSQAVIAGFDEPGAVAGSEPPRAPVRDCASRIDGGPPRRDGDTIIGPLRFNMQDYSPLRTWREMVRRDQWLKSPARVRAGAEVTLVVPPEQRSWVRLAYAHRRGGTAAVTLRACRHRRSRAARRRECVWAEGLAGYKACRSGPTFFSGGFEIDYDEAPQQGRCAELIVWVQGEQEPHRVRLLRVEPGECAGDSADRVEPSDGVRLRHADPRLGCSSSALSRRATRALFNDDLERASDALSKQLRLCQQNVISDTAGEGLAALAAIASLRGDPHRAAQTARRRYRDPPRRHRGRRSHGTA